jgi:hypothetical protein
MALMDEGSMAPTRPVADRAGLRGVPGLRAFYDPAFRTAAARLAAGLGAIFYVLRAVAQIQGLRSADLRWDFAQFFGAAQVLARGGDPYASFLATCPRGSQWCLGGYIFPPLLVEALRPLTALDLVGAAAVWLILSHLFLLLAAVVAYRALQPWLGGARAPLLLAATLLFIPLYQSLYFIQVGTLLLLLLALAAAAYVRPAPVERAQAGAWLALASVLRVTPALLVPTLLLPAGGGEGGRRVVRAGLGGLVAAGMGLIGLLALLTPPSTLEYFTTVLPRIGGGTPELDNQSLFAVLQRGSNLIGHALPAAAGGLIVLAGLFLTFEVARGAVAAAGGGGEGPAEAVGTPLRAGVFAAFLAALPVISSITWQHHLITEPLVYVLLTPLLLASARLTGGTRLVWARVLVILSYPLMWADRHITDPLVLGLGLDHPTGARVPPFLLLTGVNLLGAACLWAGSLLLLSAARDRLLSAAQDGLDPERPAGRPQG